MFRFVLVSLLAAFVAAEAAAHRLNESYVYFNVTDTSLAGRVEATLTDINKVIPIDANGDGVLTGAEFEARQDEILAYFAERLTLSIEGIIQPEQFTTTTFLEIDVDTFALMQFEVPSITDTPDGVEMEYRFLFDTVEPTHRGFALIESNTRTGVENNEAQFSLIFGPSDGAQTLSLIGRPGFEIFMEFIRHGIWHIWIGYDHILFLIALLLSSVMIRRNGIWAPADTFGDAFWTVVKIISLFTVAHSITLSLAALGVVTLSVTLVEAIIAISIAIVALDNIIPRFHHRAWVVVFAFGLFHGFGFANVLEPLGVDQNSKLVALAGFNIGVEIGQIVIVAAVFPLLFLIRRWQLYPMLILRLASAALIAIALFWFVERTFDVFGNVSGALFGWIG
ncbi:MAG: HupE/UreJ family protein [Pseudomonadota bacterium]